MQDFFPLGKWRVRATVRAISSTASTETSRQAKEGRRAQISPGGCHGHCQLQAKVGSHGLDSLEDGLLHSTCIKRQRWLNRHRKINRKGQETLSAAKKWVISHNGASWPWRLRCGGRGCARGFLLREQTDRQTDLRCGRKQGMSRHLQGLAGRWFWVQHRSSPAPGIPPLHLEAPASRTHTKGHVGEEAPVVRHYKVLWHNVSPEGRKVVGSKWQGWCAARKSFLAPFGTEGAMNQSRDKGASTQTRHG